MWCCLEWDNDRNPGRIVISTILFTLLFITMVVSTWSLKHNLILRGVIFGEIKEERLILQKDDTEKIKEIYWELVSDEDLRKQLDIEDSFLIDEVIRRYYKEIEK